MKTFSLRIFIVIILCFVNLSANSQNLLNGLQACYPLDCPSSSVINNAASTGPMLDGLAVGNVTCTTGRFNQPNTAMHFGGTTSDYILLPGNSLIKPTTSLTVSGWFKFDSYHHSDLIFTRNTCTNFNFNMNNLIWDFGQIMIAKRPGSSTACAPGAVATTNLSSVLSLNTWHHIVYYVDNSVLEITVNNGTTFSLLHAVAFDYDPMKEVVLGGTNELAENHPFLGSMDDLRFYDRKLSPTEIALLYNTVSNCSESGNLIASFSMPSVTCVGQLVTFTNQSNQDAVSFQWNMPGGSPSTSTNTHASTVYNTPGSYTISLVAYSAGGSSVTATHTVQVDACTSLTDGSQEELISCYPNPASSSVWVLGKNISQITVRDICGKRIMADVTQEDDNRFYIDLTDLFSGLYFIEIETGEGRIYSRKVTTIK